MSKSVLCPRCKGKGKEKIDYLFKWLAPITLGISLIVGDEERERCHMCDGHGFVHPDEIDD